MAAGHEIERKFLVSEIPDKPGPGTRILQGYLPLTSEEAELRVRRKGDETVLTVKWGRGLARDEEEVTISAEVFEALWPLTKGRRIEKTRYELPHGDATIELDEFGGKLEGLLDAGVRRLVLLSGRGESEAQRAEAAVRSTGAEVTIVRSAWFMQNFSEDYLLDAVRAGEVVLPAGEQLEPFVDADDIADVAFAALIDDRHIGELYELTGPRLLTFKQAVREIAAASGRRIDYVQVPIDEYAAVAAHAGVPAEVVGFLTYLFGEVLGGNAYLTDSVERTLGRRPTDFTDYARKAAASRIWEQSAHAA